MRKHHGFEAITDQYILYNMPAFVDGEETSISYIMDRSGKNERQINGERIFYPILYKDYIYYETADRYLHRMHIDGSDDEMLSDAIISQYNVSDNGIYYIRQVLTTATYQNDDGDVKEEKVRTYAIYRMDLDGKNNKKILTLETGSDSLCLLKDWVFFLDSNDDQGKVVLISPNGKQRIDLFTMDFSNYYYLKEDEISVDELSEDQIIEQPTQETVENVQEDNGETTE